MICSGLFHCSRSAPSSTPRFRGEKRPLRGLCACAVNAMPAHAHATTASLMLLTDDPSLRHRLYRQDFVELFRVEEFPLEHQVANRSAGPDRFLRDVRRRGVTDIRTERGGRRGAPIEELLRPPGV